MKVIIVTQEPFPNGMAATQRVKCYARSIAEGGVDCEVVICRRTEYLSATIKNSEGKGIYEGVPFRYIGGTPLRSNNKLIRFINDRIDEIRTGRYLKENLCKGDVLFLYMGLYKGAKIKLMHHLMYVAHKNKAYCVRDLCELPYATGAETEMAIRKRYYVLRYHFPKFDGIISISDALLNLAQKYTRASCKHIKVPIMVEYEHYGVAAKPAVAHDVPYIFHAGTLFQQKDGILGMIEAFGIAKQRLNSPIKYILTGSIESSSHPVELRQLIDKYQIANSLEFVGYLNRDQIKEYLTHASLVISNRPKSKQDYYGFSTKVGEYLASGTPLLMTNWGEAVNWLDNGKSAFIVEAEDTQALAEVIVYVFNHPEKSRNIGLCGQAVCRNIFDFRNWSKTMLEFLNQLGK